MGRLGINDPGSNKLLSSPWGIAGLIAAAAVVFNLPTVLGGFFWDTPGMRDGTSLFVPFFEHTISRPLLWFSTDIDGMLWGMWAPGYHIFNLALHAANSVMLLNVCRRLGIGLTASAVAAGLFALHPVNVEAVGWVMGRAWLLGGFFSLAAFILYLRYTVDRVFAAALSSALFFLLAMLSGLGAIMLLPLVALHAFAVRVERKKALVIILLYVLTVLAAKYFFIGPEAFRLSAGFGSPAGGFFDPVTALGYYIYKLVVPFGIVPLPVMSGILLSVAGAVPLFALYVLYSEGFRREAAALCAVVILLVPAMLVPLGQGMFPLGLRYAYVPAMGFCLLVSLLIERLEGRMVLKNTVVAVLAVAYATLTLWASVAWSDPARLWQEAALRHGDKAMLHLNHGATLMKAGEPEAGGDALLKALALDDVSEDHFDLLVSLYGLSGADGESMMYEAMESVRGRALAEYGMGFIYYKRYIDDRADINELRQAVDYLERSVAESDHLYRAYYYLGLSYLEAREYEKAGEAMVKSREKDVGRRYMDQTAKVLDLINSLRSIGFNNIPALPGWEASAGG